jgi:hypothetical protein
MPLHLIKMAVGIDDLEHLRRFRAQRRETQPLCLVRTRNTPRRAAEILAGGSLYWVIRGQIMCRERIAAIRPFVDKEGVGRCRVVMVPKVVLVEPRPFRAFQGWRYLEPKDAPRDLDRAAPGARDMPETLRRELTQLGLL